MTMEIMIKAQTKESLERENLEKKTGTAEVSINNEIQEIKIKISGIEETMEELDATIKKMLNLKNS